MVSKVAVIALVAVIAVPILLGYALNLSETTVTEYKPDGESVNVTPLLQSGTEYTMAKADPYRLNTDFTMNDLEVKPFYESYTSTNTSLQLNAHSEYLYYNGQYFWIPVNTITSDLYVYIGSNGSTILLNDLIDNGNTVAHAANNIIAIHYYYDDHVVEYEWRNGSTGGVGYFTISDVDTSWLFFQNNSSVMTYIYYWGNLTTDGSDTYVDLAAGFHYVNVTRGDSPKLNLPDNTKSTLVTIDLDSITDSNYTVWYTVGKVYFKFQKTTTDGVVSWKATQQYTDQNGVLQDLTETDLYYNPSGSNTYQLFVGSELMGTTERNGNTYYVVNWHTELRYVGAWPTLIGSANYFIKYQNDWQSESLNNNSYYNAIGIGTTLSNTLLSRTPTTRVDDAEFQAFAYSIIVDETYAPADFKTNPTTTLNVSKAGLSLEFGGNTYTVDKSGNITLGTHKISVNGLKLESMPTAGGYANKINGITISVTANPSTITFNGNWGASVSTVANAASSYTHTEWTAGEFGWNGIDQNFLMVGLLTSVGVFIALGLYVRRTRSSLWPLLIVCGGAVMLFFIML